MLAHKFCMFAARYYAGGEQGVLSAVRKRHDEWELWKPAPFRGTVEGQTNFLSNRGIIRRDKALLENGGIKALPALWRIHCRKGPYYSLDIEIPASVDNGTKLTPLN